MRKQTTYLLLTLSPGTVSAETAFIAVIEWPSWRIVDVLEKKNTIYKVTHKGFAGAHLDTDGVMVTAEAEILRLGLAPLVIKQVVTHPFLNDLHYAAPTDQGVVVVNTGLDCLELFDRQFHHQSTIPLIPLFSTDLSYLPSLLRECIKKSWRRRRGDYRYKHLNHRIPFANLLKWVAPMGIRQRGLDIRYYDFRPHFLHPNHVVVHGDTYWVTLWGPGVVIRIPDGQILASKLGRPHDGIIADSDYIITDYREGRIIIFNMEEDRPGCIRLVKGIVESTKGFLRGIAAVNGRLFAGVSAHRNEKKFPYARVLVLDHSTCEIQEDWTVPAEFGNSIFSILDVTPFYIS